MKHIVIFTIAALAGLWGYLADPLGFNDEKGDGCDGGVGYGCTVDTRVEFVFTVPCDPCVEWRTFDGLYWHRTRGPVDLFLATPGAVKIGEMP